MFFLYLPLFLQVDFLLRQQRVATLRFLSKEIHTLINFDYEFLAWIPLRKEEQLLIVADVWNDVEFDSLAALLILQIRVDLS